MGAYSTYPSNWRLESYWGGGGVGVYSEVSTDSVLYGIHFILSSLDYNCFGTYVHI